MKNFDEAKLKAEFAASPELQAEFKMGGVKAYLAFKKAEAAGRVHISRSKSCRMMTGEQFHREVKVEELNEKIAANEAELKRLSGLQKKSADAEKAEHASTSAFVEASGVACGVDGLPIES